MNLQSFYLFRTLQYVIDGIKLSMTTPFHRNLLLSVSANDRSETQYVETIREIHFPRAPFLSAAGCVRDNAMEGLQ